TLTRTYRATDECQNSATCTQVIQVFDNTPPTITCPAGITVQCASLVPVPSTTSVIASDNCNGAPVITFVSDVTSNQTCINRYTLTRTYRATDECLNSATCTQVIQVFDNTPPTITCPAAVTVQCAFQVPQPNTALVIASDNCNGVPTITFVNDVTTNQTCINRYTIVRTYRATDECLNSATCTQQIQVFDNTPPAITCPAGVTVQCASQVPPPNVEAVTASDNCLGFPSITFVNDVTTNQTCINRYTLTRTYRATDECGNSATCTQVIQVFDNTAPTLTCPAGITVTCASQVPAPNIALVTASDNCNGVPVITFVSDVTSNQTCANRYTLTRTYRATDECTNSATCTQVIVVFDNVPPSITCPAAVTVQCFSLVPPVNTGSVTTSDNCTGPAPVVTFVSDVTSNQTCVNRYTLTRTYQSTDNCGNSATCTQVITVFDNTPPTITCPAAVTVQCAFQVPAPNTATVTTSDNCTGPAPVVTFVSDVTSNQTCVNRFILTRTYRSTDACGNSATCTQVITVFDNTPPTITCPANVTVQCASQVPPVNVATVTTSDNCTGPAPVVTFVSDVTSNQTCINRFILTRTYRSTDACGNSATCTQVITVFDNTPPTITFVNPLLQGVPNNGTIYVQCYGQDPEWMPPMFGPSDVTVSDNCAGNVAVTYTEDLIDEGNCPVDGYINRYRLRWTATDVCGNAATSTIFLNLIDTIPPVINGVPADITVNCDEIPDPPTLTATDECLCACIVDMDQDGPYPGCQNGQIVTRTWTAKDYCGNITIEQQHITLVDHEGPVLTLEVPELQGVPDGSILYYTCNEGGIPDFYDDLSAESVSSPYTCGGLPAITFTPEIIKTPNCKRFGYIEQRTYEWLGVDQCGNSTTLTIIARLIDNEPPVILNVPDMACIDDPALNDIEAVDNCEIAWLTYWDIPIESPCGNGQAYMREYEASDPCGNFVRDTVILVQDNTPPHMEFTNEDLHGLGQGEYISVQCDRHQGSLTPWGLNDVAVTDDCPNVDVEFKQTTMQDYPNCQDGTVAWLQLTWTATDICGNSSSLFIFVYVIDEIPPVLENFDPDVTIGCHDQLPEIHATDNCGDVTITTKETIIPSDCQYEYQVVRDITVTDPCGNVTTATQHIQVGDGSGPIITGVVDELCNDLSLPEVSAWDPCAEQSVPVTMEEHPLDLGCGGKVIERIWSATDVCGNVSQVTQRIILNDTVPPEILVPSWSIIRKFADSPDRNLIYLSQTDIIAQLDALNDNSVTVVDLCDQYIIPVFTVAVSYADNCEQDGYFERRVYTWVATDACGNSTILTFTVDIMDDIAPEFSNVPDDVTVICSDLPPVQTPTVTDDAQPVQLDYEQYIGNGSNNGEYRVIRTWTATDACGNVASAQQNILWIPETFVDCNILLPLLVQCNSHGVVIGSGVTDGIGPFTYQWDVSGGECFIQSGQGTSTITIYIGFQPVDISLTVTDAYGCASVCEATLDCVDPFDDNFANHPDTHNVTGVTESNIPVPANTLASTVDDHLQKLNFWPNPAKTFINLSFEASQDQAVDINFINFLGEVVLTDQMNARKGTNLRKIDVSHMPEGTYLFQVMTHKEVHARGIVIMR
ncbi:MAG TPA: T9SS type A sorting domain-containing protein, partial [Saprospiraceae bacterium]|nr:T9SS type A sorting domain-containing protein [Saprospiraceae bacterium]